MSELWLSVGSADIDPSVVDEFSGFHVDVFARSSADEVTQCVAGLSRRFPSKPWDLHFVDTDVDADLVGAATACHPHLRRVFGGAERTPGTWPALSAGGIARGEDDALIRVSDHVLITAPPAERPLEERARTLSNAIERVARLTATRMPRIAIDRDLDAALGTLASSADIAEIVLGKAVLLSPNPTDAARAIFHAWSSE